MTSTRSPTKRASVTPTPNRSWSARTPVLSAAFKSALCTDQVGAPQTAIATINTITTINPNPTAHNSYPHTTRNKTLLCLLPISFLFFWNMHLKKSKNKTHPTRTILWITLLTLTTLWPSGCGSGGDPNIRITPPGTYQYQVTASSTTGIQLTQTVTLNLTVTAR